MNRIGNTTHENKAENTYALVLKLLMYGGNDGDVAEVFLCSKSRNSCECSRERTKQLV